MKSLNNQLLNYSDLVVNLIVYKMPPKNDTGNYSSVMIA